jgi:hypothetical protein
MACALDRRFAHIPCGACTVSTIIGLVVAASALLAWYLLRGRDAGSRASALPVRSKATTTKVKPVTKKQTEKPEAQKLAKPKFPRRRSFKGAAINPGELCCEASRTLAGKRFLVEHVPRLPLERCDRPATCVCKYHNFPDRRQDDERRNVYGSMSTVGKIGMQANNKRSGMDRRATSLDNELDRIEVD